MLSTVIDATAAIGGLRAWLSHVRAGLRARFAEGAADLLAGVRAKLSGAVLRVRSGTLRASMRSAVAESTGGLEARVYSDGLVPYARIHEYGGRIAVPGIVPRNAKALAFAYGGRLVFAERVCAHAVTIPERSTMRSSLEEFAPSFADAIRRIPGEVQP